MANKRRRCSHAKCALVCTAARRSMRWSDGPLFMYQAHKSYEPDIFVDNVVFNPITQEFEYEISNAT